jgi:membrane protein involved in colicin uptake
MSEEDAKLNTDLVEKAKKEFEAKNWLDAKMYFESSRDLCVKNSWSDGVRYADEMISKCDLEIQLAKQEQAKAEEEAKKKAEEEAKKKAEEEQKKRKKAEEEAKKKAEEEQKKQKKAEEEQKKQKKAEEEAKKKTEFDNKNRQASTNENKKNILQNPLEVNNLGDTQKKDESKKKT